MNRSRRLAITVTACLAVGVAGLVAAPKLTLEGQGSLGKLAPLVWSTDAGSGITNDSGSQNDPAGTNPFAFSSETRDSVHVGAVSGSITPALFTLSGVNVYHNYRFGARGLHADPRSGWVIQRVVVTGQPSAVIEAGLNPSACGRALDNANKQVDIGFRVGPDVVSAANPFTFGFTIEVVPAAGYVASACNSWTTLI